MNIAITRCSKPKEKPSFKNLPFGKFFSDHMLLSEFATSTGWQGTRIVPYEFFQLDPAASVLHYGQALFEGLKAFKQVDGTIVIDNPKFNFRRMSQGAERLCLTPPTEEIFVEGLKAFVSLEKDWIPDDRGCSLYLRPTLIGTEAFLGVRPSEKILFFVIASPVGNYYAQGLQPLRIWVEEEYLRAGPGGLGFTKAAANYANSLKAAMEAKKRGCAQVLWLDVNRKYIEEVGTMNIFFVFKNEVVTPFLDGTILEGKVRGCVLQLLKEWGVPVNERKVELQEIRDRAASGDLIEAFGTGTAAVISPVGEFAAQNWSLKVGEEQMGALSQRIYNEVIDIQMGTKPDRHNWMLKV